MEYGLTLAVWLMMIALSFGSFAAEPTVAQVAEFKGNCMKAKGKLVYDKSQWTCVQKVPSEKGLTSIPTSLPK